MVAPENWIVSYNIPSNIVMDIGPQYVSNFLAALYSTMTKKLATTTEFYTHTNGHV